MASKVILDPAKLALENSKYFSFQGPSAEKLRRFLWEHAVFRRCGMFFHDTYSENFPEVDEALRRMPEEMWDARNERLIRSTMLSLKHEWLPKDQWTKYEDETWYLAPYLNQVNQEMMDYQKYRGKKYWLFSRILHDKMAH